AATTVNPAVDTTVTEANGGASLRVPAGSTTFTGQLAVTDVPTTFAPVPFPAGAVPERLVSVEPTDPTVPVTFSPAARLTVSNAVGWAAGRAFDLWRLDPASGRWTDAGDAQVDPGGSTVTTTA